MQSHRSFLITTPNSPDGMLYTYEKESGCFVSISIKQESMSIETRKKLIESIPITLNDFFSWAKGIKGVTCVELEQHITFEMFWYKYNDKIRSSKKRSLKLWDKLSESDQIKAYYHIDTYNRKRGNAEKKYCETYLTAELWNN
jgi:hypothetical protein